jgi:hypothetical protein
VRKSGQLGKTMRPVQKTSRFARLYDQNDHSPQQSESHKSHTRYCGHFRSSRTGYVARNSAISCGLIGLRRKLRCVYIERAESREDVADGV